MKAAERNQVIANIDIIRSQVATLIDDIENGGNIEAALENLKTVAEYIEEGWNIVKRW